MIDIKKKFKEIIFCIILSIPFIFSSTQSFATLETEGLKLKIDHYAEALNDANRKFLTSDKIRDVFKDLYTNGEDSIKILSDKTSEYLLVIPGKKAMKEGRRKGNHSKLLKTAILPITVPLYSHLMLGLYIIHIGHKIVGSPAKDVASIPSRYISHRYHRGIELINEINTHRYGVRSKIIMKDFLKLIENSEIRKNIDPEKVNDQVFSKITLTWTIDDGVIRFDEIRKKLKVEMAKILQEDSELLNALAK